MTVLALSLLSALLVIGGARGANAQGGEVPLPAGNPLPAWCLAPRCPGGSTLFSRPAPAAGEVQGVLEQAIRRAIVEALESEIAEWGDRGTRDVLRALGRELSQGVSTKGQELGAAVLRAGLARAVARDLPTGACRGDAKLDAAYEGLARSAVGQLGFSEAQGTVAPACVATAEQARRLADGAVLAALVGEAAPGLVALDQLVSEAKTRCPAAVPGAGAGLASLLDALARSPARPSLAQAMQLAEQMRAQQAEVTAAAGALGASCANALGVGREISFTRIQKLSTSGIEGLALRSIVESMGQGKGPDAIAEVQSIRATIGALVREGTTRPRLVELARGLAPDDEATGLGAVALRSLESAVVDGVGGGAIDPALVARALGQRFELKGGRISPRDLLGFGDSPWIFELNGGVPRLNSGQTHVVGDTRLGYEGKTLGIAVQGGVRYFDLAAGSTSSETIDGHGDLDAWWRPGNKLDTARFELRLNGGVHYLGTTFYDTPGTGQLSFRDDDSLLVRGGLLLGVQLRLGDRLGAVLRAGGGLQYESHDSTSVNAGGVNLDSPDSLSFQGMGQLRLRWRAVPAALSLRLEGDFAYFRVSRDEFSYSSAGGVQAGSSLTEQLSLQGRLFLDLDLLGLGGFVPAAFGAIEQTTVRGSQTTQSTTVPVLGLGIVRPTF